MRSLFIVDGTGVVPRPNKESESGAELWEKKTTLPNALLTRWLSAESRLVTSLPDNWVNPLIKATSNDPRFTHVAVNREESALALCSGAFMGGLGSAAVMGASGFMTLIYAITKINYTYEIPVFYMITQRGTFDDHLKFHVSNGLYLEPIMNAINMPYAIVDKEDELPMIGKAYKYTRTYSRSAVVVMTRGFLR